MSVKSTVIPNISEEVKNKLLAEKKEQAFGNPAFQGKIILLTNDDGIEAKGLKTLYCTLSSSGKHTVRIVAPDKERSAVGHAITVFDPISVKKEYINGVFCGYSVDGTPADCVKLAITAIFKEKPDLLISGINRGANIGENIIYSGTVSAATEGTIYDIPSLAVSVDSFMDIDYTFAAKFTKTLVDMLLRNGSLAPKALLNINIPAVRENEIRGVKLTHQSNVKFRDVFIKRVDPRGREYYWMDGEYEDGPLDPDGDFAALKNNFISITPIQHDMTDYGRMDYFKNILRYFQNNFTE